MTEISIYGKWIGKIKGTNNADIFFEAYDADSSIHCTLSINDPLYGVAIYTGTVEVSGCNINANLSPEEYSSSVYCCNAIANGRNINLQIPKTNYGPAVIEGQFITENHIQGQWTSSLGTKGTFIVERDRIALTNGSLHPGEDTIFVIMQISDSNPELDDCLSAIKRAASSIGINAIRVDEVEHSGKITDVILDKINNSKLLICDITTNRPNVFYELGYAHALQKNVILIAKKDTVIPFDIKDYNIIIYSGFTKLENKLIKRIESFL